MIAFTQEHLATVAGEVDDLLQAHYEELCLHKDRLVLAPRWDQYAALQRMGAFLVVTARDDGKLVGYSAFFLNHHMHYGALVVAANDVIFLSPTHRLGTTGIRLIEASEDALRAAGVQKVVFHAKLDTPIIKVLHHRGYKTEELMLGKFL